MTCLILWNAPQLPCVAIGNIRLKSGARKQANKIWQLVLLASDLSLTQGSIVFMLFEWKYPESWSWFFSLDLFSNSDLPWAIWCQQRHNPQTLTIQTQPSLVLRTESKRCGEVFPGAWIVLMREQMLIVTECTATALNIKSPMAEVSTCFFFLLINVLYIRLLLPMTRGSIKWL